MSACIICAHSTFVQPPLFEDLLRITSDSRIWRTGGHIAQCAKCGMVQKPTDDVFQSEANEIYSSYQMYSKLGGYEQKIFTGGTARSRSDVLLDQLLTKLPETTKYSLLDVGCGAGNLLQAIGNRVPKWDLYGSDISDHKREDILSISGVKGFFGGDIAQIDRTFDIICISHVLEHVPTPAIFLKQLRSMLNPQGVLVVLVPNWVDNYFDLLVADHCSHFTVDALRYLLQSTDYDVLAEDSQLLPKEIFMLAQSAHNRQNNLVATNTHKIPLDDALQWLRATRDWAVDMKNSKMKYGVFGTAIAATWLTHAAQLEPECFVDEDTDRQGMMHLGCIIISPDNITDDMQVLVPLPPRIASAVSQRLNAGRRYPSFVTLAT